MKGKVERIDVTPENVGRVALVSDTNAFTTVGNLYDVIRHDKQDNTYRLNDDEGDDMWVCAEFFKDVV
jgi:hypothetical protein